MSEWTEDNRLYKLVPDRLDRMTSNWESCMSTAEAGFRAYKKQDELQYAHLGLMQETSDEIEEALNNIWID